MRRALRTSLRYTFTFPRVPLIHHTFAPLATASYIGKTGLLLLQPWRWKNGQEVERLEAALKERFGTEACVFSTGRECLLAALKAIMHHKDEEVIVQAYTCVVVPDAVIAAGMKPVYCDINPDTLCLDLDELERRITPKTRAIICQHTFGIPAHLKKLRSICNEHDVLLIEDCAHLLPDTTGPEDVCRTGDIIFCSFGRDKAISGITGGAVWTHKEDVLQEIRSMQQSAKQLSLFNIKRLLLYPILYAVAKPLYTLGIGKALLKAASAVRLLPRITSTAEKEGKMNTQLCRMPNACALLARAQLAQLEHINAHRRMLTEYYYTALSAEDIPLLLGVTPDLPLQKFPLYTKRAQRIRRTLKERNILLDDGWSGCTICPPGASASAVQYQDGMAPKAEAAGRQILNLPTHPTMSLTRAKKLVSTLAALLKEKE